MTGEHHGRGYWIGERGSYPVTVTAAQSAAGTVLLKGPLRLMGWSLFSTAADTQENSASVTSPAALATIVQITGLPAGDYQVNWTVGLEGTVSATDADNFELRAAGSHVVTSDNEGAVNEYPQLPVVVTVTASSAILIRAAAAGTVGAVYRAMLVIEQLSGGAFGQILDGAQVVGMTSTGEDQIDTEVLPDDGLYCGTSIAVQATFGTLTGAVWVRDVIFHSEGGEPSQPKSK